MRRRPPEKEAPPRVLLVERADQAPGGTAVRGEAMMVAAAALPSATGTPSSMGDPAMRPRDEAETMLIAQMIATHELAMTFARRLKRTENIPQQDSAVNGLTKLTRTYAAQMEALKRYRSGGEQKMTVQHVHVAEGGQAIVGNISASAPGGGAIGKTKEQPHALGYAPGVGMPRQVEKERVPVPSSSNAGP
jgi:hypothetical protein